MYLPESADLATSEKSFGNVRVLASAASEMGGLSFFVATSTSGQCSKSIGVCIDWLVKKFAKQRATKNSWVTYWRYKRERNGDA
jgi:hypothetical protein